MVAGPCYRQVLGGSHPLFRPWMMFSGGGKDLAVVRFEERLRDGSVRPIDRFVELGYDDRRRAPRWLQRIQGEEGVQEVARRLCVVLGPQADLRAQARIATEGGWSVASAGEQNLCALAPTKPGGEAP